MSEGEAEDEQEEAQEATSVGNRVHNDRILMMMMMMMMMMMVDAYSDMHLFCTRTN